MEIQIDALISEYLEDYAKEVNLTRALPFIDDGMRLVYRRLFYNILKFVKRGKMEIKSAAILGPTLEYHPHGDGSLYESLVTMVNNPSEILIGHGNWGNDRGIDKDGAAAFRYTSFKVNSKMLSYFELADEADMISGEGDHDEPEIIPVLFPYALLAGHIGIGVGDGATANIPPYRYQDLLDRLKFLKGKGPDKKIVPIINNMKVTGEIEALLSNGIGTLRIHPEVVKNSDGTISVKDCSPHISKRSAVSNLENISKCIDGVENYQMNLIFTPVGVTVDQLYEKVMKEFTDDHKFNIVVAIPETNGKRYITYGVDDWLNYCFNIVKKFYIKRTGRMIANMQESIRINKIVLKIQPILKTYLGSAKNIDWDDFTANHLLPLNIAKEDIDRISKMSIRSILNAGSVEHDLLGKISILKYKIQNADQTILDDIYKIGG